MVRRDAHIAIAETNGCKCEARLISQSERRTCDGAGLWWNQIAPARGLIALLGEITETYWSKKVRGNARIRNAVVRLTAALQTHGTGAAFQPQRYSRGCDNGCYSITSRMRAASAESIVSPVAISSKFDWTTRRACMARDRIRWCLHQNWREPEAETSRNATCVLAVDAF